MKFKIVWILWTLLGPIVGALLLGISSLAGSGLEFIYETMPGDLDFLFAIYQSLDNFIQGEFTVMLIYALEYTCFYGIR